ncbi:MAG: NADH-quinone oxidoreductase subunit C [Bacteroidia bacterium]|nr:NADH-quinone oxidoreductase subunit C [Bacteroidia bacterium]
MYRIWSASFLERLSELGSVEQKGRGWILRLSRPEQWAEVAWLLKEEGKVDYFLSLTATHLPPQIALRYDLRSLLCLTFVTVFFSVEEEEEVPSVAQVWPAADWHEREAYDLVGVRFAGRSSLTRILLPQDWQGHPLRVDYAPPDSYKVFSLRYEPPHAEV